MRLVTSLVLVLGLGGCATTLEHVRTVKGNCKFVGEPKTLVTSLQKSTYVGKFRVWSEVLASNEYSVQCTEGPKGDYVLVGARM